MQQPMFGQIPHMFGPIIMGGPGGLGQHGQGMGGPGGLGQHGQGMRPGGGLPSHEPFSHQAHEGGKDQGQGHGSQNPGEQLNNQVSQILYWQCTCYLLMRSFWNIRI